MCASALLGVAAPRSGSRWCCRTYLWEMRVAYVRWRLRPCVRCGVRVRDVCAQHMLYICIIKTCSAQANEYGIGSLCILIISLAHVWQPLFNITSGASELVLLTHMIRMQVEVRGRAARAGERPRPARPRPRRPCRRPRVALHLRRPAPHPLAPFGATARAPAPFPARCARVARAQAP